MDMTVESKCATSILLDMYGNSLLILSIRCMNGINQIGSILQCMAILYHLEQNKILKLLDDAIWRSLFVACSAITMDISFSHKAICALFATLRTCNTHLDPVVYTVYCTSFSKFHGKKGAQSSNLGHLYVDPFHHLEQIGITWLIQKSYLPHTEIISHQEEVISSDSSKTPLSSSPSNGFWDILRGKKKNIKQLGEEPSSSSQVATPTKFPYSTLPSDLSKILQLSRDESFFKIRRPRNILLASLPIPIAFNEFPSIEKISFTDQLVEERILEIQDLYRHIHGYDELKSKSSAELENQDESSTIHVGM